MQSKTKYSQHTVAQCAETEMDNNSFSFHNYIVFPQQLSLISQEHNNEHRLHIKILLGIERKEKVALFRYDRPDFVIYKNVLTIFQGGNFLKKDTLLSEQYFKIKYVQPTFILFFYLLQLIKTALKNKYLDTQWFCFILSFRSDVISILFKAMGFVQLMCLSSSRQQHKSLDQTRCFQGGVAVVEVGSGRMRGIKGRKNSQS